MKPSAPPGCSFAEVWPRDVISSSLVDLTAAVLVEHPELSGFPAMASDSDGGCWRAVAAIEKGMPTPVPANAPCAWLGAQKLDEHAHQAVSTMANGFESYAEKATG